MGILILGAGSFAREVADLASDLELRVIGFVVNVEGQPEELRIGLLSKPVWNLEVIPKGFSAVPGFVSPERRKLMDQLSDLGYPFAEVVHPSASVSSRATLHGGLVVSRNATVSNGAVLSFGCIVNRGATIGHDALLGPWSTVGPGANLAGGVRVGMQATVGMGANVLEGRAVGAGAFVGAGAVVTRDVPPGETWAGVPARRLR